MSDRELAKLYLRGEGLRAIGRAAGMSHQKVHYRLRRFEDLTGTRILAQLEGRCVTVDPAKLEAMKRRKF